MRILENNADPIIRCPHCNSLISYGVEDVFYYDVGGYATTITCGACENSIELKHKDIPRKWWAILDPN